MYFEIYCQIALAVNLLDKKIAFSKLRKKGRNFLFQYPFETYGYAFFFSLSGYLGINFVLTLVKTVGALAAVTGKCLWHSRTPWSF